MALSDFASSPYWHSYSTGALRRTPLDLILFDRLSLHQNKDTTRNLVLKGKQLVVTDCQGNNIQVSGVADYILGYCHAGDTGISTNFEATSIVIEAKRPETMSQGIPQIILYLAGIQQHRKRLRPGKIATTVYGTITDGHKFEFLRLSHDGNLQISAQLKTSILEQRNEM